MTDRIPTTAMILAAGLGSRLRPLTDHLPKPLLPIGGRPLLEIVIDTLGAAGCRDFVINTHHLPGQINDYLHRRRDLDHFTVLHEPEILGTGGALVNAAAALPQTGSFLLHNADVLTAASLPELVQSHSRSTALVTLLLIDHPAINTVAIDPEFRVLGVGQAEAFPSAVMRTYSGVAVIDRDFLSFLPPPPCSLVQGLITAISALPGCVRGHVSACDWNDMGTLERYRIAHRQRTGADGATGPVRLLPPAADTLLAEAGVANGIYGAPLAAQASERVFCRVGAADDSRVLMQDAPGDALRRYVDAARFLEEIDAGGPHVFAVDEAAGLVLMEDLGDRTLYGDPTPQNYRRVLDTLLRLQTADPSRYVHACEKLFDRDVLLWETGYFRQWFLERDQGLDADRLYGLESEFAALAEAVQSQPITLMHRDFQSQNILLQGDRVRLIDFQDLQRGPYAYDLMSLLRDPYHRLEPVLRRELMDVYHGRLQAVGGLKRSREEFHRDAALAGLQRNMQALGAYSRLSLDKGKIAFRQFIPVGLLQLQEGLIEAGELGSPAGGLKVLSDLVGEIIAREE